MTEKQIRKSIFGEMIKGPQPKHLVTVRRVWKLIFIMQDYGYDYQGAKKRLGYRASDFSRHTFVLFWMRRGFILESNKKGE